MKSSPIKVASVVITVLLVVLFGHEITRTRFDDIMRVGHNGSGVDATQSMPSNLMATDVPTPTLWPPNEPYTYLHAGEERTIEEIYHESDIVAEFTIIRVDPLRFNTMNGELPTPDPSGDTSGLSLTQPIVIRFTHYYKGAGVGLTGAVIWSLGGTKSGFTQSYEPPSPTYAEGSEGVAFLGLEFRGMEITQPSMIYLDNLADSLSDIDNNYELVTTPALFLFQDEKAVDSYAALSLPRQELVDRLNDVSQGTAYDSDG